jgi:DNA-binding NarL/FixJ family response regulator
MYLKAPDPVTKIASQKLLRIVVADSDAMKVATVSAFVDGKTSANVRACMKYPELLPMLSEELPDVLFLGFFDSLNFFSICRMCRKNYPQLPIVLLSRQTEISDEMRRAAINQGATDIITTALDRLDTILQPDWLQAAAAQTISQTGQLPQPEPASPTISQPPTPSAKTSQTARVAAVTSAIGTGKTILAAIQEIDAIGQQFFGPLAQGNYWRKTHTQLLPEYPDLQHWAADHFGVLSCTEPLQQTSLTVTDVQGLQKWVKLYIDECQRVIVDFGDIVKDSNLSPLAIQLLPNTG